MCSNGVVIQQRYTLAETTLCSVKICIEDAIQTCHGGRLLVNGDIACPRILHSNQHNRCQGICTALPTEALLIADQSIRLHGSPAMLDLSMRVFKYFCHFSLRAKLHALQHLKGPLIKSPQFVGCALVREDGCEGAAKDRFLAKFGRMLPAARRTETSCRIVCRSC